MESFSYEFLIGFRHNTVLFFSQGGAVLDKSLQPHESHIPFILQFLVKIVLHLSY